MKLPLYKQPIETNCRAKMKGKLLNFKAWPRDRYVTILQPHPSSLLSVHGVPHVSPRWLQLGRYRINEMESKRQSCREGQQIVEHQARLWPISKLNEGRLCLSHRGEPVSAFLKLLPMLALKQHHASHQQLHTWKWHSIRSKAAGVLLGQSLCIIQGKHALSLTVKGNQRKGKKWD